jgi:hypothetical protein
MINHKFGELTILNETIKRSKSRGKYYLCKCSCGNIKEILGNSLKLGNTKSCGCFHKEKAKIQGLSNKKHGECSNYQVTKEYTTWISIKQRCNNKNNKNYNNYGGRGIKVCDRWLNSFENFLEDMGRKPKGYSIERINNNGNYEPNNCKWIPINKQYENKRRNKKAKLNILKAIRIRFLYNYIQTSQYNLSKRFNCSRETIRDILNYKEYKI